MCLKTFENFGDSILTAHSMHGIGEVREKTQKSEKRWRSRGRKSEFTQSGKILASLHFVLDLQWQHKVEKLLTWQPFNLCETCIGNIGNFGNIGNIATLHS